MKTRSLTLLALLVAAAALNHPATAAPTVPGPPHPGPPNDGRPHHGFGGPRDFNRMPPDMGLDLTPAQQKKFMELMRISLPQRRAILENPKLKPAEKRAKIDAIRAKFHAKMNAILTPAQRKKRDVMVQERRKWMERQEAEREAA